MSAISARHAIWEGQVGWGTDCPGLRELIVQTLKYLNHFDEKTYWCNVTQDDAITIGNMRYVMFYASHCRLSFLGYSPFSQWELRSSPDATFGHELSLVACRPLCKVATRQISNGTKTKQRRWEAGWPAQRERQFWCTRLSFLGHLNPVSSWCRSCFDCPQVLLLKFSFHCYFFHFFCVILEETTLW